MDVDGSEQDEHAQAAGEPAPRNPATETDLERIAGDLADIERALERLDDGSYWTDEVTGEAISDELLAADPTARRTAYPPAEVQEPPPSDPA
jgi:RNA polymerase-binding transcription factor DksA